MKARILDFIDFERVNILLEGFNQSTGFVTAILDLDGNILSKSGWRHICTEFHRNNPDTAKKCTLSDTLLASKMGKDKKFHFYKCMNGLIDVAVPIILRGEHVANLFSGQFFFEEPDISFYKNQARIYGFEEVSYLEALRDVPVISEEKAKTVMEFLQDIAQMIMEITLEKLELVELNEARKKTEIALSERDETIRVTNDLLEKIIKHTHSIFVSWDSKNIITAVNAAYESLTGRKAETVIGQSLNIIFPRNKADYSMNFIEKIATENILQSFELEIESLDGSPRTVLWSLSNIYASDGKSLILTFSQGQDITERITAEQALQKTTQELQLTFKNMINAFVVWESVFDDNGIYSSFKFGYFNDAYAHIAGLSLEEVRGKNVFEVWPDTEASWVEVYGLVATTGVSKTFDMYHVSTKGWYHCNAYRPTESTEQVCVIFEDITERKKIEEENETLRNDLELRVKERTQQLLASNKELDSFTYSVSHDLKAPLRGIDGYSKLLYEEYYDRLDDEGKDFIAKIRQSTERMNQLIEDLLLYSRLEKQDWQLTEIELQRFVLEQLQYDIQNFQNDGGKISIDLKNMRIMANPEGLAMVFKNLAENAIKYSKNTVEPSIKIDYTESENDITFQVKDNGIGFDMKYHDRIFNIFERLHRMDEYPGTGIGLAIVKKVAERLNGKVWATSEIGKGSVFYFCIPKKGQNYEK